MTALLLVWLLAVSLGTYTVLGLVVWGCAKRRMLSRVRGIACDAPGGAGMSVLCSGVKSLEQVENLLSVEYSRYEVIVVLDAQRYAQEMDALAARYRMIRVEWATPEELRVSGVRALGRSRRRCFRRLVLVDRAGDTPEGDFDAALAVATYDYVLPVREGQYLLSDAVARLVAELGEYPSLAPELIRTWIGTPTRLLAREAVVTAGGFAAHPLRRIPRARRCVLWEPLIYATHGAAVPWWVWGVGGVLTAGSLGLAAMVGWSAVLAFFATVVLVCSASAYAAQAVRTAVDDAEASLTVWRPRR